MRRVFQLQRGFWTSVWVSIAWMAIPVGVYSMVQGSIGVFAVLNIVLGVVAIVLAMLDPIAERLTSIRVEFWRVAAFLVLFLYFGLSQVFGTVTSITLSAAEQTFFAVYRVITVVTMAIVIWQLVRAVRNSSVSAK